MRKPVTVHPLRRAPFDLVKRVVLWLLCGFSILSGYYLAKLEPFASPQLLTLTSFDQQIPLVPWTIWIYGSGTMTCLLACLMTPDRLASRRLFFTLTLAAMMCWIFFLFWPTTYPRELYPLPLGDSWTLREFHDLRTADSPTNCFPSQHVALAWGLALVWVEFLGSRKFAWLPLVWAAAVSITTLTTKQHYIIDIPAGIAIGIVSWWIIRSCIRGDAPSPVTRSLRPIRLTDEKDLQAVTTMLNRVENHQWSLQDIDWPTSPQAPLSETLIRLLNQVIYIEEIAGKNFEILAESSVQPEVQRLYALFADEERRHAAALRKIMLLHGGEIQPPSLGNALVLEQYDTIDPSEPTDAILVAMATPVFETFLDAGTLPFLQTHPALKSPYFDGLIERINQDEASHIALDWLVTRHHARTYQGMAGLGLVTNLNIFRGAMAIPWMSLDVYSLAYHQGYKFQTLIPAFSRLWNLHKRTPELANFPLWWIFRIFVLAGMIATHVCVALDRRHLMFAGVWVQFTRLTDLFARLAFGKRLLIRRGLPIYSSSIR